MSDPRFHIILKEMADLYDKKSEDYGDKDPLSNIRASEDFGVPAWLGALIRGHDKVSRLKTFAKRGILKSESVEDSLLDLANYSVISLLLYREEKERKSHEQSLEGKS